MILTWTTICYLRATVVEPDTDNTGVKRIPITRDWSETDPDNTGVERIPISHKESARQKVDPGEEHSPALLSQP